MAKALALARIVWMGATLKKIHPRPNMEPDDEIDYIKPNARTSYCYVRLPTPTKSPAEISIKGGCMTIGGLACRHGHGTTYAHHISQDKNWLRSRLNLQPQVGVSICDAIENTCSGAKLPLAPLPAGSSNSGGAAGASGCIGALRIGRGLAQVSQLLERRCL